MVLRWSELSEARPDLAAEGAAILYQFGVGLAFLATVRADGGPRLHPVCPLLTPAGCYVFVVPSPKQADLRRDGRYALHSFPRPDDEDALYLAGAAVLVDDAATRDGLAEQFVAERRQFDVPPPAADHLLVELLVDRALLTRTSGHGDPTPRHEVFAAP